MTPNDPIIAIQGFSGVVNQVCWSPDGELLVAVSADSSVQRRGRERVLPFRHFNSSV